tara:strand:- start:394 stop:753 length:360 start_codon:yes stop_codon:yes gene_type:complete
VDTNTRGCVAEYLFGVECLKRGIIVSFPLLNSCVYDCIADTGKNIYRIQIKSTGKNIEKGRSTVRANWHNRYSQQDVDYFAVWVDLYKGFFIFKNKGQQSIRLSKYNSNWEFFNNFDFR